MIWQFNERVTQDFARASRYEWLETNGLGGWASSTVGVSADGGTPMDGGGSAEIAVPARGVDNHSRDGRNLPTWILF